MKDKSKNDQGYKEKKNLYPHYQMKTFCVITYLENATQMLH